MSLLIGLFIGGMTVWFFRDSIENLIDVIKQRRK